MPKGSNIVALFVVLCACIATPLAAANLKGKHFTPVDGFASNLGRTMLVASSVIVEGTIAEKVEETGTIQTRVFVVSRVIWGELASATIKITYTQENFFDAYGPRMAIALSQVAVSRLFEPIGKPIDMRDSEAIKAVEDLIAVDATPKSIHTRARLVKDTLFAHLMQGGTPARFASIEMIFLVNYHPQIFARNDYTALSELITKAETNTRVDLKTAQRHLVFRLLKRDAEVALRLAAGKDKEEAAIMRELQTYFIENPAAFDEDDVLRMAEIGTVLTPKSGTDLLSLQARIDLSINNRKKAWDEINANRPRGLRATGNAGAFDENYWRSRATFGQADRQPLK